jgi:hypothetical protein
MTIADWLTAGLAVAALLLSGYSILRQRASSKPHWDFDWGSMLGDHPGSEYWRAEVRQAGPGEAERVNIYSRVKDQPGSVWESWVPYRDPIGAEPLPGPKPVMHPEGFADWDFGRVMRRGEYAWKQAKITNNGKAYTVQMKIEWVESPNTHRKREHVESHEFAAATV